MPSNDSRITVVDLSADTLTLRRRPRTPLRCAAKLELRKLELGKELKLEAASAAEAALDRAAIAMMAKRMGIQVSTSIDGKLVKVWRNDDSKAKAGSVGD